MLSRARRSRSPIAFIAVCLSGVVCGRRCRLTGVFRLYAGRPASRWSPVAGRGRLDGVPAGLAAQPCPAMRSNSLPSMSANVVQRNFVPWMSLSLRAPRLSRRSVSASKVSLMRSRWRRFLTTFASGTRWKVRRGPLMVWSPGSRTALSVVASAPTCRPRTARPRTGPAWRRRCSRRRCRTGCWPWSVSPFQLFAVLMAVRPLVNEGGGVVQAEWAGGGDAFGAQDRVGQLLTDLGVGVGGEEVGGGVDVDHGHSRAPICEMSFV